ncbi:MAG: RlmE family RNA methyltransferase [Myxococcales bacterium]|nr:MAG: RlmE family RNA methyltransferase [Myxococcales bacterium]
MAKKRKSGGREQDHFALKAKALGYPARSVFKLEEIDRRTALFKSAKHVLDLGAAPGSWSLYASRKLGQQGKILAIDLNTLSLPPLKNLHFIQGDIYKIDSAEMACPEGYDVVMSDMAPSTTGTKQLDHFRSVELVLHALELAKTMLNPEGRFVAKIFQGPDFDSCYDQVKKTFKKTRVIRPEAVRKESVEVFLYGQGLKTTTA